MSSNERPQPHWRAILAFWATAWAIFAVLRIALVFWLDPGSNDRIRLLALLDYAIQYGLWALLTPVTFWFSWRFPINSGNWTRRVPFHFAVGLLVVVATMVAVFALHNFYAHPPEDRHAWTLRVVSREIILYGYHYNLLFYLGILTAGFALNFYHGLQQQQLATSRAEAQMLEARMHSLRMQLHPHFLFNTLNTVANLTERDPRAARRVIARLSELLRRALASSREHEVTLAEEMRFAGIYMEIVKERFADRLHVDIQNDPATLGALVPSLILQPILENAVEHGIAMSLQPAIIRVTTTVTGETLSIQITDNGGGLGPDGVHEGIGLSNTRERLAQLYGTRAALTLAQMPSGGVVAAITLPLRYAAQSAAAGEEV